MTTFANGESGLSVRTKINNVLQHADGTTGELVINEAGADVDFRVESDTNANALFVDGATGNVGIGTSSPAAPLHVVGNTYVQSGTIFTDAITSYGGTSLALNGGSTLTALTSGSERLRIDSSGNVGIGTSSPTAGYKLDVAGNIYASAGLVSTANGGSTAYFGASSQMNFGSTGSDLIIGSSNTPIRFGSSSTNTEWMRIDSSGNLLVGTTSPYSASKTTIDYSSNAAFGITLRDTGSAIDGVMAYFVKGGAVVGSITSTTSATSYSTSSDYRLKEDVQPMVGASDRVLSLNPVNFAWKADGSRTDGFIAHEVQEVAPYAVTGEKDGEEMQAMDHSKLVPLLTAALQEALQKIEALEARITALEA